jgi:alpha-L-arabinofuranosidase
MAPSGYGDRSRLSVRPERDALISALTLDTFNRHADKVAMANVAQLINNLHCLFLAHEDKFLRTPTYHVFDMYGAHRGGKSARTIFSAPTVTYREGSSTKTLWGLAGSASLQGRRLVLTVVNPHHSASREAEIAVKGASIKGGEATALTAGELNAHNTFSQPDALAPKAAPAPDSGPTVVYRFPPASVTRLSLEVG